MSHMHSTGEGDPPICFKAVLHYALFCSLSYNGTAKQIAQTRFLTVWIAFWLAGLKNVIEELSKDVKKCSKIN